GVLWIARPLAWLGVNSYGLYIGQMLIHNLVLASFDFVGPWHLVDHWTYAVLLLLGALGTLTVRTARLRRARPRRPAAPRRSLDLCRAAPPGSAGDAGGRQRAARGCSAGGRRARRRV